MTEAVEYIHLATAADENFARPLAVTVRSLLNRLGHGIQLRLYVVDGGISAETKERLLRSWRHPGLKVAWIESDFATLGSVPVSGHVTRMTYARLLLPLLLPKKLHRVIYFDSDLLILRDIAPLWRQPIYGAACLAAVDAAAPRIDAELALPNYPACGPHLASPRPIPNYRELGLDPRAHYFNAGIMCLDLELWRSEGISQQAFECLDQNRDHIQWWDQYALNVVLYGRWRPLHVRWNQGAHIYCYPSQAESPFDAATYWALRKHPWIVHFSSQYKPWHWECNHPYRRRFYHVLDQTEWRGWRPAAPYNNMWEWLELRYCEFQKARNAYRHRLRMAWKEHTHLGRKAA
jgi:lipopolysaccharide biosynthesis glycosyltransferase